MPRDLLFSFNSKCVEDSQTGCWNWTRSRNDKGYGQMWDGEKLEMAHRLSYRLFRGEIPEGCVVHHECYNKSCVNPDHLKAVTPSENLVGVAGRRKRG